MSNLVENESTISLVHAVGLVREKLHKMFRFTVILALAMQGSSAFKVSDTQPGSAVSFNATSNTNECQPISSAEVRSLWDKWNNALQTLDPEVVGDQYHSESLLLPTLSNIIRTSRETKLDYFEEFLLKKPVGSIKEDYVSVKTCNAALYSGIYTFNFTAIGDVVDARFTYVFTFEDGDWKIATHHSSKMPAAPTTITNNLR